MSHAELFADVPFGRSTELHWSEQGQALLDAAAAKLVAHGFAPWVFAGDARRFWQFAGPAEMRAFEALTPAEHDALLGEWSDEDHDPTTFGC